MEGETDLDDLHEDKIEIYRIIKYKYIFFYNTFLIFFPARGWRTDSKLSPLHHTSYLTHKKVITLLIRFHGYFNTLTFTKYNPSSVTPLIPHRRNLQQD